MWYAFCLLPQEEKMQKLWPIVDIQNLPSPMITHQLAWGKSCNLWYSSTHRYLSVFIFSAWIDLNFSTFSVCFHEFEVGYTSYWCEFLNDTHWYSKPTNFLNCELWVSLHCEKCFYFAFKILIHRHYIFSGCYCFRNGLLTLFICSIQCFNFSFWIKCFSNSVWAKY